MATDTVSLPTIDLPRTSILPLPPRGRRVRVARRPRPSMWDRLDDPASRTPTQHQLMSRYQAMGSLR
ncbi:hypothetical protein ACQB6S_07850 [Propionibacteriaceae bacterium Y1923]